ncbi:MAG: hypothetical protein ACJAYC_000217 [Halieaceae bacterium]|jgi:hypothetical protein
MSKPYATVLLPTHDSHATLPHALASGCNQTIENIQILVACDGATISVLEAAKSAAAKDSRITVLDMPKGHNRGGEARAKALRLAKSDRIFVLQDDDLWFPNHIELLGAALDDHDVATNSPLSVRTSGSVATWTCNYNFPDFRRLALKTGFKLVFEAHYAFSLKSYYQRKVRWERMEAAGNIKRLLDCHLADAASRWNSISQATALSFKGPIREHIDTLSRADEIVPWAKRIQSGLTGEDIAATSQWGSMLRYAAHLFPPIKNDTLQSYFEKLGLQIGDSGNAAGLIKLDVTAEQHRHLQLCYSFLTGGILDADCCEAVILDLMEPFAGPNPHCWRVGLSMERQYGLDQAIQLVRRMLPSQNMSQQVLVRGLLTALTFRARQFESALEQVKLANCESTYYQGYFEEIEGKIIEERLR